MLHSNVTSIGKERSRLETRLVNLEKELAVARDVLVDIDATEQAGFPGLVPDGYRISEGWGEG